MSYVQLLFLSISISHIVIVNSETYIVNMDLAAMPKSFSSYHSWFSATLNSITTHSTSSFSSSSSKLIYTYSNAIHGFAATLSPSEMEILKNTPGYLSSIKDAPVHLHTTHTTEFMGLNSRSGSWPAGDYGEDVIIGFVDTGVWPESESFNDDGVGAVPCRWKGKCEASFQFDSSLCNKKLIGARYFNKGFVSRYPNMTTPINSTRDIDGHGTFTSSVAAGGYVKGASYYGYGNGTATGVAPHARIAIYKALWDEYGVSSDVLAAIDQAIADGVDILSLSIGGNPPILHQDPIAIGSFAAIEKGIFVSAAAGNNGPHLWSVENGAPWVLTVAASSIDREFTGKLTLGNGVSVTGLALHTRNHTSNQLPMVFKGACEYEKVAKILNKKVVVCLNNNGTLFDIQYWSILIRNPNALGIVFITNNSDLSLSFPVSVPYVILNLQSGKIIRDYIQEVDNGVATTSMKFHGTRLGTKPAPSVASFSARGPSYACPPVLKPDLTAPGSLIIAFSPIHKKNDAKFNLKSGTSVSCPHASGVAALLKAAHPEWSPSAIRSAMMTTSYILDNTFKPIQDIGSNNNPATPLAMGSGHVLPNKALNPGLIYDIKPEDYIYLLCGLNYTKTQIQTITRSSTFNCSNPSLDINYPSFIAYFDDNNKKSTAKVVQKFRRTVTYVGDGSSTFRAALTPIVGLNVTVSPETLCFHSKNEKQSYTLSIEGPTRLKDEVVYGFLSWIESKQNIVVRSPIVATSLHQF